MPNKIIANRVNKANLKSVNPRDATEKTLQFLSKHLKASIRSKTRLQLLRLKAQTEKLEAVLEMIVNYVDQENYNEIMNDNISKITQNYFDVLKIFMEKFGEINPDDL